MAIVLTPTLSAQKWGPKARQVFNYFPNATRAAGGNALMIYRHGGAGVSGVYTDDQTVDREIANFTDFLTNPATAVNLGKPCDVMFIETGQRSLGSAVQNGDRLLMVSAIRELQLAIASVKRLGVIGFGASNQYKINPAKVFGYGFSWGAPAMMLTQLFPTYQGSGWTRTFSLGQYRGASFDSSLAALIFNAGQVDIRTIAGTDQIHYSQVGGYLGLSTTNAAEWNAFPALLKETLSCLAYFDNGDFPSCPPTAVLYNIAGDGLHPYGSGIGGSDIHDSQQGLDLATRLQAAGIRYISRQYAVTNPTTGWQNGTAGKLVNCQAVYDFISSALDTTL